ncbi:MAG: right-handed parallel beta-helix repeat-containing protein [Sumerlaeia bacterium]
MSPSLPDSKNKSGNTPINTIITSLLISLCALPLWGQSIAEDAVWTLAQSPILTPGVSISDGASLTIEAGVEVRVGNGGIVVVQEGGELIIEGTDTDPVVLTHDSETPAAGGWSGVFVREGATASLRGAVIEYAGAIDGTYSTQALLTTASSDVEVEDCVLRHSAGDGLILKEERYDAPPAVEPEFSGLEIGHCVRNGIRLDFLNTPSQPTFENLNIHDCGDVAIQLTSFDNVPAFRTVTIQNTAFDGVDVSGGNYERRDYELTSDVRWRVRYLRAVNDITVRVGPGTEVMLKALPGGYARDDGFIQVAEGSAFLVEGTAEAPAVFTSDQEMPKPGDWDQAWFDPGSTVRLSHCRFEYFDGILSQTADVELRSVHVDWCSGTGAYFYVAPNVRWGRTLVIDSTFTNCVDYPIQASSTLGHLPIFENLTLSGNGEDVIFLGSGVSGDFTPDDEEIFIGNPGYPYKAGGLVQYNGYHTTIAPGTIFQLSHVMELRSGQITFSGTAEEPIQFIPHEGMAGLSETLRIGYGARVNMEHCIVNGGVTVDAQGNDATRLDARDCDFSNATGREAHGARITGAEATFSRCSFRNNPRGGITVSGLFTVPVIIENCEISNNLGFGANAFGFALFDGCDIVNNGGHGFEGYTQESIPPETWPEIRNCRITGNGGMAVANLANFKPLPLAARHCWWGDPSGPFHDELNPAGLGGPVSDHVAFSPWLTSPEDAATSEPGSLEVGQTRQGSTQGTVTYALTLAEGDAANLLLRLRPVSGAGSWRLTERDGQLPTPALFDRAGAARDGGWNIPIPAPQPGVYFIAVQYSSPDGSPGLFELSASDVVHYVTGIETAKAGNAGAFTQQVTGCGFVPGTLVELMSGGASLRAFPATELTDSRIVVPMDLTGLPVGVADVVVIWPDTTEVVLAGAFEISDGAGPEFWAGFSRSSNSSAGIFRPGRDQLYAVYWGNRGDADAPARLLSVTADYAAGLRATLEDEIDPENLQILAIGPPEQVASIPPGYEQQVDFFYRVDEVAVAFAFQLESKASDSTVIDWESQKDTLRPGNIDPAAWQSAWPAIESRLGATTADHMAMLVRNAQRLSDRGSASPDPAWSVSHLVDLEIQEAAGQPVSAVAGRLTLMPWGRPQPAAAVKLYNNTDPSAAPLIVRSNGSGDFCFTGVEDGIYDLVVDTYFLGQQQTITVSNPADITGLEVAVWKDDPAPPGPDFAVNGRSPALTFGPAGSAYLAWENGGELWSLAWTNGQWQGATSIAGTTGAAPFVTYHANLFGAGQPGLLAIWESADSNQVRTLTWSAGERTASGFRWTVPQQFTQDPNDDTLPQLFLEPGGAWNALWLQRANTTSFDDTDLYSKAIDLASRGDWWTPPATKEFAAKQICDSLNFATSVEIPKSLQEVFGKRYAAEVGFELCDGDKTCGQFSRSGGATIAVELGDALKGNGAGQVVSSYRLACKPCRYMPWTMSVAVSAGLEAEFSRPLPILIGGVPVGTASASLPVALAVKGNLMWRREFSGAPDTGFLGLDCTAGGRVTIEDNLGVGKGQGDLNITGSYQWNPNEGFKVDGACVTLSGEAAVFGGFAKRKIQKQWGDSCGKSAFVAETKTFVSDNRIAMYRAYLQDGIPITESIETTVSPATGTGGVYEGTAVLASVAGDLYDDGQPAVWREPATGHLTLAWTKDVGDYASGLGNRVVFSTNDGSGWTAPIAIQAERHFNRDVALAQEPGGGLMAVWSQASASGLTSSSAIRDVETAAGRSRVVFAQQESSSAWSAPALVADLPGRNDQVRAVGAGTRVVVAWVNTQSDIGSRVMGASWNGAEWSSPAVLSGSTWSDGPSLATVDSAALLVWSEDEDGDPETATDARLRYAVSTGGVWSAAAFIPAAQTSQALAAKFIAPPAALAEKAATKVLPRPDDACCGEGCKPTYKRPRPQEPPAPRRQESDADMGRVQSFDPNEKHGPRGWGVTGIVEENTEFLYTILFENKASASAPAQEVFIVDDLSPDLDWSTFKVRSAGWGDKTITFTDAPSAIDHYETVADYRPEQGGEWLVNVRGFVNRETGRASFTFRTLDPIAEEPPLDPLAGFLPPNDDTHRGEGFVTFSLAHREGLTAGASARIDNTATIIFDLEDPIVTNTVHNRIDDIPLLWQGLLLQILLPQDGTSHPDVNGDGVWDAADLIAK